MARSLDQISKDLTKVNTETEKINDDLKSLYREYLTVLGKATKQQLVLAVYHLCTQAYPEKFLKLSVSQREKVQAKIRKIATQGQAQIEQLSKVIDSSDLGTQLSQALTQNDTLDEQEHDAVPETDSIEVSDRQDDFNSAAVEEHSTFSVKAISDSAGQDETQAPASRETSEMLQRLSASLSLFAVFGAEPLSPVSLAKRHVLLERHLRATLQTLSSMANHLLKLAQILPDLPEMVIAAAAEAEAGESGGSGTPNVLNVLVEIGGDIRTKDDDSEENDESFEEDEDPSFEENAEPEREMTHLVAINLKLADIEFADAHTAMWRSRLQEALIRLKRLGSRFQKLQQEKARADAEHAWRATWFEE